VSQSSTGGERYVAYTIMPTSWGDTLLYGMQYDSAAFAAIVANVMDKQELLPAGFMSKRANRDVITVQVSDRSGNALFRSQPSIRWGLDTRHTLDPQVGALQVRAQIRQPAAEGLVIGGSPSSRLPFLFVLLGLAVALVLVALAQMSRESDLARAREGFVSSISHELRTPVAQIRLYLETLRLHRVDDAATRDWSLSNIDRETQRLSNLVDNVLRFSRTTGDIAAEPPALTDVAAETRALVDEFRPLAASRKVNIRVDDDGVSTHVWISPDALRHIILNLFDNAVKYGPQGQTIGVRIERAADVVRITVTDQGPGIPAAERSAIWEPFNRGSNRQTKAAGGSGIGLTIVRDLVRANDGTIRVEDAPGRGAAFIVELPLHRPEPAGV
jgi:signal transduction histidine kinase